MIDNNFEVHSIEFLEMRYDRDNPLISSHPLTPQYIPAHLQHYPNNSPMNHHVCLVGRS